VAPDAQAPEGGGDGDRLRLVLRVDHEEHLTVERVSGLAGRPPAVRIPPVAGPDSRGILPGRRLLVADKGPIRGRWTGLGGGKPGLPGVLVAREVAEADPLPERGLDVGPLRAAHVLVVTDREKDLVSR